MITELFPGVYAVTVFIAFAFLSWIERKDHEQGEEHDFYAVFVISAIWPLLLCCLVFLFVVDAWKKWVSRG